MEEERPPRPVPPPDAFERDLATDLDDETDDRPRGMPQHTRILLGLVIGAGAGAAGHSPLLLGLVSGPGPGLAATALRGPDDAGLKWVVRNVASPIGALFLRLLL